MFTFSIEIDQKETYQILELLLLFAFTCAKFEFVNDKLSVSLLWSYEYVCVKKYWYQKTIVDYIVQN